MIQWPAAEGLGASVSFLSILVCRASGGGLAQDFGPRSNSRRHGCLVNHAYTGCRHRGVGAYEASLPPSVRNPYPAILHLPIFTRQAPQRA